MVVGTRVPVRVGRCQALQGQPEKVVLFCCREKGKYTEGQNSPSEQENVYRKGSEGQNSPNEQVKCLSEGFRRTKLPK